VQQKYNFSAASEELSLQPNLVCNDRDLKKLLGDGTSSHRNFLRQWCFQTREESLSAPRALGL